MPPKASRIRLDRATVVQAAAALIDKMGLEEVTLTELAAHLNVRLPSLYNHVAGLPGLRREIALFGVREMVTRLGQVVMGKAGGNAIIALAHAYRVFIKEHPGLYAATIQAPAPDDVELQAVAQELINIILKVLAAYGLHDEDALHAVRGFRSIVHGFATLESAHGFEIPIAPDETFRRLIAMFVASIKQ